MSSVQLLRMSVYQRIISAAEDVLQQLENGKKEVELRTQRAAITARLTAAAEEVFGLFRETVAEYEDRLRQSEQEVCRQRKQLDALLKPEVRLQRSEQPQHFNPAATPGTEYSGYPPTSGKLHNKSSVAQLEEDAKETGALRTVQIKIRLK